LSAHEGCGGEEKCTPFTLKWCRQEQTIGQWKKHKFDKKTNFDLMVLTEGNLDEIGDKVRDTTT